MCPPVLQGSKKPGINRVKGNFRLDEFSSIFKTSVGFKQGIIWCLESSANRI